MHNECFGNLILLVNQTQIAKLEVESLYSQNTVFFFRSGAESKIESKKYARYVFSV